MRLFSFIALFLVAFPYISFAQESCDYKVEILVNNSEFESKDFSWRMRATKIEGPSTNITGTAEILDSNEQIIRKYRPWTNESISKQKTSNQYSPNLKDGDYNIKAYINVSCEDKNKNNNFDVKAIMIKEKPDEIIKTVNQIYIQNGILEEKINNTKNEATDQISSKILENKTSRMRVSSLTTDSKNESEQPIESEEDNIIQLKNPNKNNQKNQEPQTTSYAIKNQEIVYESSNEKAKGLIILFLLILSVLLNIILIWKR